MEGNGPRDPRERTMPVDVTPWSNLSLPSTMQLPIWVGWVSGGLFVYTRGLPWLLNRGA